MGFQATFGDARDRLRIAGDCRMADAPVLDAMLRTLREAAPASVVIDLTQAGDLDIGPSWLLHRAVADLRGVIEHRSYESWADCRDKLVRYATAGAEKARREGRRAGPLDVMLRPPLRFLRMYVLQLGFLDGARGVAVCALAAAQVLLRYADLWAHPLGRADGGARGDDRRP